MIDQTVTQPGADGDGILVRSRAGRDRLERGPQQATGVVRSAYTAMQHAVLFSEVRWETDVAYGSGLKTGLPSTTRWRVVDVARLASPRLPRRRQAGGGDQAAGRDRQQAAGSTLGQRRRPQCGRNVPSALVLGGVDDLVALPGFRGGGQGLPAGDGALVPRPATAGANDLILAGSRGLRARLAGRAHRQSPPFCKKGSTQELT